MGCHLQEVGKVVEGDVDLVSDEKSKRTFFPILEGLLYERPALGRRHLKQPPTSLHLSPVVKTLLTVSRQGSF